MQVIFLEPGEPPRQEWLTQSGREMFDKLERSRNYHVTLAGLNYRHVYLGLFVTGRDSPEQEKNEIATLVVQYLRDMCTVKRSLRVYGTAVLYNYKGDMTEKLWKRVNKVIHWKKKRSIPSDLVTYCRSLCRRFAESEEEIDHVRLVRPNPAKYGEEEYD